MQAKTVIDLTQDSSSNEDFTPDEDTLIGLKGQFVEVKRSNIRDTNMLGLFSLVNLKTAEDEQGEILTGFEFEEEVTDDSVHNNRNTFEMHDGKQFFIKTRPTDVKKLGYYANEARGRYKPNCFVTARYYRGRPRAQLRVLTQVRKGKELLWHYGDSFDGD